MAKKRSRSIAPPQGQPEGDNSFARSVLPDYPTVELGAPMFPELLAGSTPVKSPFPDMEVKLTPAIPNIVAGLVAMGVKPKAKGGK